MTRERILCAMSGGVDSSTAAAVLVEQGHEVVGVTLHLSDAAPGRRTGRCCAAEDVEDARKVARHLRIPHYTLDYRELFRSNVIEPFVAAYAAGRTPTPCTSCNDSVKVAPLVGLARRLGLDALATGHYARIDREGDRPVLRRAADEAKDQSYFLFPATPDVLAGLRLPLGDRTKAAVREDARRLRLPVAEKAESMEVCFAPDGPAAFVESVRPDLPPGEVVDEQGRALGRHAGVHRFTVGQRRGLPAAGGRKLYVLGIDAGSGRVVAGPEEGLLRCGLVAHDVRWHGPAPEETFEAAVQIRHRAAAARADVRPEPRGARVRFREPQRAVAPGQAAVFYDGDRVVGGGWISTAVATLALAVLPGCEVGSGEGAVGGSVDVPGCVSDSDWSLRPDFFGAEVFDDSLTIHVQRGGDYIQFTDGLVIGVADTGEVGDRLGEPIAIAAPDPGAKSSEPLLLRASLHLSRTCDDGLGLTGVGGTVTFDSIYGEDTDRIDATFAMRFEDVAGGEASADLEGWFRFDYERGRPAQRYP